jgi:hypothetical protein
LSEGKHHQIRRIAKRSGFHVVSLHRVRIAGILSVDSVPEPGQCRWLTDDEIGILYEGLLLKSDHNSVSRERREHISETGADDDPGDANGFTVSDS